MFLLKNLLILLGILLIFSVCKSQTNPNSKIKVETNNIKTNDLETNDTNDLETNDTNDLETIDSTSKETSITTSKETTFKTSKETNDTITKNTYDTNSLKTTDTNSLEFSESLKVLNSVVSGDYSSYNKLLSNYSFSPISGNQAGLLKNLNFQGINLKGSDYNLNNLSFNDEFNIDFLPILFINNIEFENGINSIINSNNSVPISILLNSKFANVKGSYTNLMYFNNYNSSTIFDGNYKRSFDNKVNASFGFRQIKGIGDFTNQKKNILTLCTQLYFPISSKFNINIDNIYSNNSIGESKGIIEDNKIILEPKVVVNDTLTKINVFNLLGVCGDYNINENENINIILSLNYESKYFTNPNNSISISNKNDTKFNTDKTITLNYSNEFSSSDLYLTLNLGNTSKKNYYQIGSIYNFYNEFSKTTLGTKLYYEGGINSINGLDFEYYLFENFHLHSSVCKNIVIKDENKIDQFVDSYIQFGTKLLNENCLYTNIFYLKERVRKNNNEKSGISLSFMFPFYKFTFYSSNNYYFKNLDLIYSLYSNNHIEYLLDLFNKNLEINFQIGCELTSINSYNLNSNLTARIGNAFLTVGLNNVTNSYFETSLGFPYRSRSFNFGVNWAFTD